MAAAVDKCRPKWSSHATVENCVLAKMTNNLSQPAQSQKHYSFQEVSNLLPTTYMFIHKIGESYNSFLFLPTQWLGMLEDKLGEHNKRLICTVTHSPEVAAVTQIPVFFQELYFPVHIENKCCCLGSQIA